MNEKTALKSKYSNLSKQELVNILAEVPVQFVYDLIEKTSNDAYTKYRDVQIDSLKKVELLKESIKNNGDNLNKVLSEAKKIDKEVKRLKKNYDTLNDLLRILERVLFDDFELEQLDEN